MDLSHWTDVFKPPGVRRFQAPIADDHVLDAGYQGGIVEPQSGYFEVRVAETFLDHRSEYGRSFVPLTVAAVEFLYGGAVRNFPFIVGPEVLRDIDAYVKGEDVRLRNTRVVGPVPYAGGDVALFVGLYRTQVDDLARRLLEMLGGMVSVFNVGQLSAYVATAGTLADGLYKLLGFKQIEFRTGDRDVFQDHGSKRLRAGYRVHANAADDAWDARRLWVRDNMLHVGADPEHLTPATGCDYCLVEVQGTALRSDYTSLPFHAKWKEARERVSHGNEALGQTLLIECCRLVADSPDLTPANAEALIQAYQANYAKDLAFFRSLRAPEPERSATVFRAAGGPLLARQGVVMLAQAAQRAGVPRAALEPLDELCRDWDTLPLESGNAAELTDPILNRQLSVLRNRAGTRTPVPKALADALAVASVAAA